MVVKKGLQNVYKIGIKIELETCKLIVGMQPIITRIFIII